MADGNSTFMRITNKDVFESVQNLRTESSENYNNLHDKIDKIGSVIKVHHVRIQDIRRVAYGTAASFSMICGAVIIWVLTK